MAEAKTSKKVGGSTKAKVDDKDQKPKGKSAYDYSNAVRRNADGTTESIVKDGKLIDVPREIKNEDGTVVQVGFSPKTHKPLTKKDFVDEAGLLRYQAYVAQWQSERFAGIAADKLKKAETLAKFGDPKTRKKVSKLERLRKAMEALEAELAGEGVELDDDGGEE